MEALYELGITNIVYWSLYGIGFIVMFIFNSCYGKKYHLPVGKALCFSIICYAVIFGWSYILAYIANGFSWGHHNAIRVYVWMPLVLALFGKIFKIEWKTACDYIAPSTCLVYAIARLGCVFAGCCYGIPCSFGMYNVYIGYKCFPVQLCQSLCSFAVFAIILLLAKRKEYLVDGTLYPIMLVLYGTARFFLDFLQDNKKLFSHISELAIWGLLCVIMGLVWLSIIKKTFPLKKVVKY